MTTEQDIETTEGQKVNVDLLVSKFALFSGATYYPAPGWKGLTGFYETLEAAVDQGKKEAEEAYGWWQVVDLEKREIVAGEGSGHSGLFGKVSAY